MKTHPIEQEELMAYLDGELPVQRAAEAAAHLENCRGCQSLAADLQGVQRRLLEWQVDVGQASGLPKEIPVPEKRPRKVWRWATAFVSVGVAGVLVVSLGQLNSRRAALQGDRIVTARLPKFAAQERQVADALMSVPIIARTSEITITTNNFDQSRSAMEEIVKRRNGYFGQLNVNANPNSGRMLDATLKIPAPQREPAIAELKKLGRVEFESQTGEEVTAQSMDLEARLNNARNTEQRLTDILRSRTGKLSDVLAVEESLSRVRGEIEKMEAEQKALANRVDFLALQIHLQENYRQKPDSIVGRLRDAAASGYEGLVSGITGAILLLLKTGPSLIFWAAVLFFPARFVWRKLRR